MSHAVLFTQCMQRDFIAPISEHVALPNRLHVGRRESLRLLGRDPAHGPLAQLMGWARAQKHDEITIIHVRDWHAPSEGAVNSRGSAAESCAHFDRFGRHGVANTLGAALVLNLDEGAVDRPNEHYVNATGFNDFFGTGLNALLTSVRERADEDLRVGVVGVWTEAKVSFLLYELATRCGFSHLATCSALTASSSRTQHFHALDQVERLLGVQVIDSVGGFAAWLNPIGAPLGAEPPAHAFRPKISVAGAAPLSADDLDLISVLHRGASEVHLRPLPGGSSGTRVFRVASTDAFNHHIAPTVTKLGPRAAIAAERVAFEKVEAVLGNDAPMMLGFADIGERAGITYAYAAMGGVDVRTFHDLYGAGMPPARVRVVIDQVFGGILERLTSAAHYERLSLLDAYTFSTEWADSVQRQVEVIIGGPAGDRVDVQPGVSVMNPAYFYRDVLPKLQRYASEFHYVSYVHGDLNAANVLLDDRDNAWIIDFAHTSRSHVLKDVAKFENDLQYILTPISNDDELRAAMALTRGLVSIADLATPLPPALPGVDEPVVRRCVGTLRALRQHTGRICREERNPTHLALPLLRYAVHTLGFDESTPLQKRWALYAAGLWAESIAADHLRNQEIRVDWVEDVALTPSPPTGRFGITICPGRADRGRSLNNDIAALVAQGVEDLVCLLPEGELEQVGVSDLAAAVTAAGMSFVQTPIQDQQAAPLTRVTEVVDHIDAALRAGRSVVVHCMGGLGRSGMVAAGVLTGRGLSHSEAVAAVRRARGPRAVETLEQEQLVRDLARQQRRRAASG